LKEAGKRGSRVLYGEGDSADEVAAYKFVEEFKELVEGREVLTKTNLQL
jgi:hypothetical protein